VAFALVVGFCLLLDLWEGISAAEDDDASKTDLVPILSCRVGIKSSDVALDRGRTTHPTIADSRIPSSEASCLSKNQESTR
jgi:hypothetical protein